MPRNSPGPIARDWTRPSPACARPSPINRPGSTRPWCRTRRAISASAQKLYDEKLRFSLDSTLSRAEIKQRARGGDRPRVRGEMYDIARTGAGGQAARAADAGHAQRRAAAEGHRGRARARLRRASGARPGGRRRPKQALADATAFVRAKNLVTVPDDPVKVILMPEFQRGVARRVLRFAGPARQGAEDVLRDLADPGRLDQAADRFVPARIQLAHDPAAHHPRGDAGPLPGGRAFGAIPVDAARGAALGPVRRRLGGLRRTHDDRRRVSRQRSAVQAGAAQVLPAHRSPTPCSTRACTSTAGAANRRCT